MHLSQLIYTSRPFGFDESVLDPPPNPKRVQSALDGLERTFPELGAVTVTRAWAGCIDSTPDAVPVIDAVGEPRGLVIATGFSGHGFKFCSGVGEILADLSIQGATRHATGLFSLSRSALTGVG